MSKNPIDNIALGADGQANHLLALLRSQSGKGSLAGDTEFLPGLFLNADPALELRGQYRSPPGQLLELEVETGPRPGGWVALHLSLPVQDIRNLGVIGFAARGHAPEMTLLRACLRSGTGAGFVDCFFDKHILLRPEEASHIDALPLRHREGLPERAPWRELVLFLPTRAFQLVLCDLRVFAV